MTFNQTQPVMYHLLYTDISTESLLRREGRGISLHSKLPCTTIPLGNSAQRSTLGSQLRLGNRREIASIASYLQ